MTTRILHVSDTHLGNRQYGSDVRRADFADAFEEAITYGIDEDVHAVIHTGDLFDTRDPRLPDLNRCIDILQTLADADIPFYGIVGNHERKMDDQYLDLIGRTGTAERLDRTPQLINDEVAVYGIDAVTKPAWHAEDFTLEEPPGGAFTILCMHQLLQPPVPEIQAEHPLADVLDRVNIDLDALALGDYHESVGTVAQGTKVWYAGSTERCAINETAERCASLLEIDGDALTRRESELDTRPFLPVTIEFAEDDGHGYAENVLDRHDVTDKVIDVTLTGTSSTVTARDVREIVLERDAAICRVDDQRGGPDINLSEGPTGDIGSKDRLIEEKLAEQNLSDIAVEIEERVRTEKVPPSGFDDDVEALIEEVQAETFDTEAAVTPEDSE
jgi:DNA repair exonuclease SbcCD nuclease subunit